MDKISVSIRVRPLSDKEQKQESGNSWEYDGTAITQFQFNPATQRYAPAASFTFGKYFAFAIVLFDHLWQ